MEQTIRRLKCEIQRADAVLIGAGAELSASAGFTCTDKRFEENFADFEKKYGFGSALNHAVKKPTTTKRLSAGW